MILTKNESMGKIRTGHNSANGVSWEKNMKNIYTWTNSPCLHVLSGLVTAHKVCLKNYECYHCAYDQWLEGQIEDAEIQQ